MSGAADITAIISSVYGDIRLILLPLAVLGTAACGIGMMTASDPESVKKCRNGLFTVICAAALFELSPFITGLITGFAELFGQG